MLADRSPDSGGLRSDLQPQEASRSLDGGADLLSADAGALIEIANEPFTCPLIGVYVPKADQAGYLAAVRLTPPRAPFSVEKISYRIAGSSLEPVFTNIIAHRVELSVGSGLAPESTPNLRATLNLPAISDTHEPVRTVVAPLPSPLVLGPGEHLFVAIELPSDGQGSALALVGCIGNGVEDRNYWSNAARSPYAWIPFQTLIGPDDAHTWNLQIAALGR
jgi:hypothetical protein